MSGDRGNLAGEALAAASSPPGWACPACRQAMLSETERPNCTGCGLAFPRVGRVPILLADAQLQISAAAAMLGTRRAALDAEIASLRRAVTDPLLGFRTDVLELRLRGLSRNERLLRDELSDLLEAVVRGGGPLPTHEPRRRSAAYGEHESRVLYTDWGRSPEGEAEVAEVCALAGDLCRVHPRADQGRALFLGAGTGRHVIELSRRFGSSSSIDLSIDRTWLFDQVLRRPLEFAAFESSVPRLRDELTRLARTEPPAPVPGLRIAVADARQLPLPDSSVSVVFSIYFTDMLPLWQLLPEVRRVLIPGGSFVHVGPLHYAFEDAAWHLGSDELPVAFRAFGLEVEGIRETTLEAWQSNARGLHLVYQTLAFRAVRVG